MLVAVCGVHMLIFQGVPNPHTVCAGQRSIASIKLGPGKDFPLHGSGSALKVYRGTTFEKINCDK